MGFSYLKSPLLLSLLIVPLILAQAPEAQDLRTSTSFSSVSTIAASSSPVQDPSASPSIQPLASQPLDRPLLALPTILPSPIPSGVAKTASGKPIPCSPKNTKLNPTSHKLISECVETSFCAAPPTAPTNGTGFGVCYPRTCSREQWPYGYGVYGGGRGRKKEVLASVVVPPMCGRGMFCPDNGSGCRLTSELGAMCELARDEQCRTPPLVQGVSEEDNKAVCLKNVCRAATEQLNAPCSIENTTYVSDIIRGAAGGGQFTSFVIKHNCLAGLFCDPTPPDNVLRGQTCQKQKKLGENCRFDAECQLNNCVSGTCVQSPEVAFHIAPWQWLATALFIVLLLVSTVLLLAFIHRRQRYARYQELQEYYCEQMSLRRSILALHAAAGNEKLQANNNNMKISNGNETIINEKEGGQDADEH